MKFRGAKAGIGLVLSGALLLGACTSDPGGDATGSQSASGGAEGTEPCLRDAGITETADGEIRYSAGPQEWSGYNSFKDGTYSTYNSVITAQLTSGFVYFGTDGTICRNEEFGTFEVTSEDPMVVEYKINEDAVWSDGTPVTVNDFLLEWAAQNPEFVVPGLVNGKDPNAKPLFEHVSASLAEDVLEGPQGELNGKTFKVEYSAPNPDYQLNVGSYVLPEHVVAKMMGLQPGELAQAILDRDAQTVRAAAEHWNTGWNINGGKLPDMSLMPSFGPYKIKEGSFQPGNSVTLTANEKYWGTPAATKDIVFRFLAEEQQVASLGNGELNVIQPQATVDTIGQIEALGSTVSSETGSLMTWEHLDFNFRENNIFGDPETGFAMRQAMAYCVPRQTIVDTLIKPISDDTVVMNAREVFPFQEDYDDIVSAAYDGRYDQVNIEEAKKVLADAGISTPVDVRIGYLSGNQRRAETVSAIAASCKDAGINVIDANAPKFFDEELKKGDFDIALYAWAGSGQITSGQNIYGTDKPQNRQGYSNAKVDEAFDKLSSTLDESVHVEQTKIIEQELWNDLQGLPLYAHPQVIAYSSNIENVRRTATQSQVSWNAFQWKVS